MIKSDVIRTELSVNWERFPLLINHMFEYDYIVYDDDKPGEAINTLCDSTLAKTVLNWECKFNIKDYILNYIGSYE